MMYYVCHISYVLYLICYVLSKHVLFGNLHLQKIYCVKHLVNVIDLNDIDKIHIVYFNLYTNYYVLI